MWSLFTSALIKSQCSDLELLSLCLWLHCHGPRSLLFPNASLLSNGCSCELSLVLVGTSTLGALSLDLLGVKCPHALVLDLLSPLPCHRGDVGVQNVGSDCLVYSGVTPLDLSTSLAFSLWLKFQSPLDLSCLWISRGISINSTCVHCRCAVSCTSPTSPSLTSTHNTPIATLTSLLWGWGECGVGGGGHHMSPQGHSTLSMCSVWWCGSIGQESL